MEGANDMGKALSNVLDWLEASQRRTPDKVAFADPDSALSYTELMDAARRVGSFIAARCEARLPIALFIDKSTSAIAALFGVVYAGCCYSFIDLRQPQARVEKILDQLQPGLVFVDAQSAELAREVFPADVELIDLALALDAEPDEALLSKRRVQAASTDPLYINFTSGSTGTPKGVVVGHASVMDFIPVFTETLGISSEDSFANQAPFDFDVSIKDICSGIYLGATVHLIPRQYFSVPAQLLDYLCERQPTVLIWAVSAMCFVSIMGGFDYKVPKSVRLVGFSGEVMPVKQLAIWRSVLSNTTFVNLYGPTEITCNCTYHVIDRDYASDETIPMGKAFANEHVFLVGDDGTEVTAPWTVGELYVGGPCLALGYYRDPERTAKAFVQNPLHSDYLDMVYKTGDLAQFNEDGDLVFLSRADHQIKHMGQRIELGEIEAAANAVEGVSRACCIYDDKKKRIRMFYTGEVAKQEVSEALRRALPPYMTPNNVQRLTEMPLSKNGKIDRALLSGSDIAHLKIK